MPPPLPNSLSKLANRVLEERNRQPKQSTPDLSRKRRRSSSSPPTIRNCLIVEEGSPEKLRGVERLETSLGVEEQVEQNVNALREELEAPTGEDINFVIKTHEENSIQSKEEVIEKETRQNNWNREIEKREEMEKSEEKKERKTEKSGIDWTKVTKFSDEGKGKIKRYKIGDGMFVEMTGENKDKIELLEKGGKGQVWLAEDLTLEIRNENEDLIAYFDIEEVKQITKCESTENKSGGKMMFITWRDKLGDKYGVGFYKAVLRNKTYKYIDDLQKEIHRDTPEEDLGFGLFD